MAAFLGMRGTGDWPEGVRPESWREMILFLYPNGKAPLTAIMSMMASEQVTDPRFHWEEQSLPLQGGAITGVFIDAQLANAYVSGAVAGDVVYVQAAQDVISEFRNGHAAMLEAVDSGAFVGSVAYECQGKVIQRVLAGANSFIAIQLDQTPDASADLNEVNYVSVVGNSNPEGATMPDAIQYEPEDFWNYTQIFRTPLSITRTARRTKIRSRDAYLEAKRQALELHAIEMEKAFIWGVRNKRTGHNGKPERKTGGLIWALREFAPENIVDYRTDTDFAGMTWAQGGEAWLDKIHGRLFQYGATDKLALHGSGVHVGLKAVVKAGSTIQVEQQQNVDYGITVRSLVTGEGVVNLKSSPLFSLRPNYQNAILYLEPSRLQFEYIDDTFFVEDPEDRKNRNNSKDATEEEYITEAGLAYPHIRTAMLAVGVGMDNELSP